MSESEELLTSESTAELRAEIERLKRELHRQHATPHERHGRPSKRTLWFLSFTALIIIVGAFLMGYLPRMRRESLLVAEANAEGKTAPTVNVVTVEKSSPRDELVLPGDIQPITEAPLLARASGYIKHRYADIGDRVPAGKVLAEIDAMELDQQVQQAEANLQQVKSSLEQATANLQQGRSNEQMAQVTAQRWKSLASRGVVSKQENDNYQSQFEAQKSNVQALEKAVNVARSNVTAAEANVARLKELQKYLSVRAPFAGVITMRNVDVGTLVTEGNTLLFRIAQTDRLRTYVNVPQADATSVHVGQAAQIMIPDLPSQSFPGKVTRTANSLDPSSRTLLTEVQAENPAGQLLPGMYALVKLTTPRRDPPLLIPGDSLVMRANGPQVALVGPGQVVHYQPIQLGRDFGDRLEVLGGLKAGQMVVVNPGDDVREQIKVNPVPLTEKKAARGKG